MIDLVYCFLPYNNNCKTISVQIMTNNDSSRQDSCLNLTTVERQLSLSNEKLEKFSDIQDQLATIILLLNQTMTSQVEDIRPRDCLDLQRAGVNESGQYKVYPDDGGDPFFVWCDMETDGGGWTVSGIDIHRNTDNKGSFFLAMYAK